MNLKSMKIRNKQQRKYMKWAYKYSYLNGKVESCCWTLEITT